MESEVLLCARCAKELEPGSGDLFEVRILALADPSPPKMQDDLSPDELRAEIQEILRQLENVTETEARNQVYRTLMLYFCGGCFHQWIESPAG